MFVPLMSRWVTPWACEYLRPLRHAQHERQRLLGVDPGAQLHEIAEVHALDVFHDHVVAFLLPALVDDLHDVGMAQPHAGFGFLVKSIDRLGHLGEALAQYLDRQRSLGGGVFTAIDASERPFGQVKKDLSVAEEEPAGVALLEAIDLPARERALSQQHPDDRVGSATVGGGPGFLELFARDQADHCHLVKHHFSVEFGHERVPSLRFGLERATNISRLSRTLDPVQNG